MSLIKYRKNVYSQFGEDGILDHIFTNILDDVSDRKCVEFGAWDGIHFSNTYNLLRKLDFSGVFIEGDSKKFSELVTNYSSFKDCICLNEMITRNNLDSLLANRGLPKHFDFISIDIDSYDYFVWKNLKEFHPKVVLVEANSTFGPKKKIVKDSLCSARALVDLGKEKGYELVSHTGNLIFVEKEYFSRFGIKNNSIETLFDYGNPDYFGETAANLSRFINPVKISTVLKKLTGRSLGWKCTLSKAHADLELPEYNGNPIKYTNESTYNETIIVDGIDQDGWAKSSIFVQLKNTEFKKMKLVGEFPGWASVSGSQIVIKSTSGYKVTTKINSGLFAVEYPNLVPNRINTIEFKFGDKFKMPAPDARSCSALIRELSFE